MAAQNRQSLPFQKLVLFCIFSVAFLFTWNYFFPPPKPVKTTESAEVARPTDGKESTTVTHAAAEIPTDMGTSTAPSANSQPKVFEVREDRLAVNGTDVLLSSRGGRIISEVVTEPERFTAAGDLYGAYPKDSKYFPVGLTIEDGIVSLPDNYVYEVVEDLSVKTDNGYLKIVYRFTDPGNRYVLYKTYEADPKNLYQLHLSVQLENKMTNVPLKETVSLDIYGYEDPTIERSFLETRADRVEGVCKLEDDLERVAIDKLEKPELFTSPTVWGAVDHRYFVFGAIPKNLGMQCSIERLDDDYIRTKIQQKSVVVKPNESVTLTWHIYSGPKNFTLLTDVGHNLREVVDFGMLSFIARPLRWALVSIQSVVTNWGLAIIILTIFIRLLLWPFNQMAYSQTEKMRRIQPKINEIKEKYKGDPQKIQEEQFKLMRESGTTPFGCLPMFLQFPILLALYFMILNSVELYHADFILWYTNLADRDPYFVLPILMGVTMFIQQHFMAPEMDPSNPAASMQKIMKFMPVIFTSFMLFLPSGVVLYYFVSLLIGLGQQWYIRESIKKKYEKEDALNAATE